jgi:hypothetical protein
LLPIAPVLVLRLGAIGSSSKFKQHFVEAHHRPHRLGLKPQAHSENPLKRVKPDADHRVFNLL